MYETIKNKVISAFTLKRVICGVLSIISIYFACSLIGGYLDTRADYQRTREQLERTQRALDESRKLNQQLRESIATSQQRLKRQRDTWAVVSGVFGLAGAIRR